ncbi:hypothetical protein ACSZNY_11785 [Aeromonas caviae]
MKGFPKTGLYISTKKVQGMRLIVEDVFGPEDEDFVEEDDFYLVNIIDESHKNDASAIGDELDSHQWQALVEEYGLVHQPS